MAEWGAIYEKGKAYEINFFSAKYEEAKAVEKVCCAIMDKKVGTPDDVQILRHGEWVDATGALDSVRQYKCSECGEKPILNEHWCLELTKFCPFCGAKMG
jgi:hypothetical protein